MSEQSRNQEFLFQYRNVALAQGGQSGTNPRFCGYGPIIQPSIPDNMLELKNIFAHLVMRFDASVPSGKRRLLYIGGQFDTNFVTDSLIPDTSRAAFVNLTADANRYIDCQIDLTKWKDAMLPDLSDPLFSFTQPQLIIQAVTDTDSTTNATGDIILWKIDLIYTTKGIQ